jgi:hypothetical protein
MFILGNAEMLDSWSIQIRNGNEFEEDIICKTYQSILDSEFPNTFFKYDDVAINYIDAFMYHRTRRFLVVMNKIRSSTRNYIVYIYSHVYGNNLEVAWYLFRHPTFMDSIRKFFLLLPIINRMYATQATLGIAENLTRRLLNLDFFDELDLKAFITNIHHCLLDILEKTMLGLGEDTSTIDRHSKGFLGIS